MNAKHKAMLPLSVLWGILLTLLAVLPASAQTTTYSGDTSTAGTPVYRRPQNFNQLSNVGTAAAYNTYTFRPTVTGNYRIRSTAASGWDNFLFIYNGSFNAAAPLTNLIALNDALASGAAGVSGFTAQPLTANIDYIIVTAGFTNIDFGVYTNIISPAVTNGNTTGGATFARPDSNNPNVDPRDPIYPVNTITNINARYEVKTFSVTQAGLYRIQSEAISGNFDPFAILYRGTFDPAQPLNNVVIANEDFGSFQVSGFDIGLDANQTYTLVTTGSSASDFGQYYWSLVKLHNFRAGFSGSTVGRSGIDISTLSNMFEPPLVDAGNAVPFRAFRVSYEAGGFYRFQLFSRTFSANAYNPLLAGYLETFNNSTPNNGIELGYADYPLLDTGDFNFDAAGSLIFVVSGYKNLDAGDFRLEAFGDAAVTITPVAVVKGTVTLKTFTDNPPASPKNFPVKMVFRPTPNGADTFVNVTLSSSNGNYVINVPEATNNVGFKSQTLQKVVAGVNTTTGVVTGVDALNLLGADANDDNFTDISDLLVLIAAYNKISPAAGYNALADFNFDGTNDIADLLIIIGFYNQSGQFLP